MEGVLTFALIFNEQNSESINQFRETSLRKKWLTNELFNQINFFINKWKSFINIFHVIGLFLHPLKSWEHQRFSDVFREYRKTQVKRNGLNVPRNSCMSFFWNFLMRPCWKAYRDGSFLIIQPLVWPPRNLTFEGRIFFLITILDNTTETINY